MFKHVLVKNIWDDIAQRMTNIRNVHKYINRIREMLSDLHTGEIVATIDSEDLYEKLKAFLRAQIDVMYLEEQLKIARQKAYLKGDDFWLQFIEETGIERNENLIVDPDFLVVRKKYNTNNNSYKSPSYQAAVHKYVNFIKMALEDVHTAGMMSNDENLPWWLRKLCRALISTHLSPTLRKELGAMIEKPYIARQWLNIVEEENIPEYFVQAIRLIAEKSSKQDIL